MRPHKIMCGRTKLCRDSWGHLKSNPLNNHQAETKGKQKGNIKIIRSFYERKHNLPLPSFVLFLANNKQSAFDSS